MQGKAAGIRWETQDQTLILTIDRQHRRNALDPDAHHQLASLFDIFSDSDEHFVAIITGAGDKAFCSGSDLSVGPVLTAPISRRQVSLVSQNALT